jgi:hypothetical protein
LVFKNEVPKEGQGEKEKPRSTVSWEYEIDLTTTASTSSAVGPDEKGKGEEGELIVMLHVFAPFAEFKPFYRGRPVEPEGERFELGCVRRVGFMVRSYFGRREQEGAFRFTILRVGVGSRGGVEGGKENREEEVALKGDSDDEEQAGKCWCM